MTAPTVSRVSPSTGPTTGGTSVTVTGTGFVTGASVSFAGTPATDVTVVNATSISAMTPAGPAGAVDVVVTNPDGLSDTISEGYSYDGSLSITSPPSDFSYSAALNGSTLDLTSSFSVSILDTRGTGVGWNLQATISALTGPNGDVIPANGHVIKSVALSGVTGTVPSNSVAYPIPIPTSSGKIFNAAPSTGTGQSTETFTSGLTVPADAASGSYSAILTVTVATGP